LLPGLQQLQQCAAGYTLVAAAEAAAAGAAGAANVTSAMEGLGLAGGQQVCVCVEGGGEGVLRNAFLIVACCETHRPGIIRPVSLQSLLQHTCIKRLTPALCFEMSLLFPLQATQQLLDALDTWESFGGSGPTAKGARVYAGPYSLAPIPPRPIMVDTAADEIDYPEVSHRCAKRAQVQQSASTLSRLWRGWGS
jgi:hypothetical protein